MLKSKKNLLLFFLTVFFVFTLSACDSNNKGTADNKNNTKIEENNKKDEAKTDDKKEEAKASQYPMTIKDSADREVVLENEPEKVISIAPSITEIIFSLDKGDKLIGRTSFCNYPEEVKNVEVIGSLSEPNIEKIVELDPDLVIVSTHFEENALKKLESLNINVVLMNEDGSIDGTYTMISEIGKMLNANAAAEKVVGDMKEKIDSVIEKVKDAEKPLVYYVVGFDFTAGKGTFVSELIEKAGGENAANDVEGWSYSLEKLVEKDPDILITTDELIEEVKTKNGYKDLTAVKEDNLYSINQDILNRQGPRIGEALEKLAKIIHPELFK